jgi:hypothetical protein
MACPCFLIDRRISAIPYLEVVPVKKLFSFFEGLRVVIASYGLRADIMAVVTDGINPVFCNTIQLDRRECKVFPVTGLLPRKWCGDTASDRNSPK